MTTLVLVILGLCLGSFVNAFVWRLHEQPKKKGKKDQNLSITRGRSMCPHCRHTLAARDLVPVFSWLFLKGRCRYCKKPISWQYPAVELLTAVLFVLSYILWPVSLQGASLQNWVFFGFWLVFLVGFIILAVYDLKWQLLPNAVVYPLLALAITQAVLRTALALDSGLWGSAFWGLLVGGGLFYLLFQISGGKWIGGGDVKLGAVLGILVGGPLAAIFVLFIASWLAMLATLPLLALGKANRTSRIPFGPFLIAAGIIVYIFGADIAGWYRETLLLY